MKKRTLLVILALVLGLSYLLMWPVEVDPQLWYPPAAPTLSEAPYQANEALTAATWLETEPFGVGPEDVAVDSIGRIYGGLLNGIILRYQPDGSKPEIFAETNGRPLGMTFDKEENLIVADAIRGLLSVDRIGQITVLATSAGGEVLHFTDDLDIAEDGKIYFSDASSRFGVHNWRNDLLEHRGNGRLLVYDPATKTTEVLLSDLYFANGVAVSADQQSILFNETAKYRVRRYWLSGPKAGTAEVWIDNLPGFPDNLSRGSEGIYWVAIPSPRNSMLDHLLPKPFLRKVVHRLPEAVQPNPTRYGMVLGLDETGQVRHNLQATDGDIAFITSVKEVNGTLYLGSLEEPRIGILARP
ncbi:MAG: SMP-30/gluconolactonase/LRE family protein [Bacteroidota bacterium]